MREGGGSTAGRPEPLVQARSPTCQLVACIVDPIRNRVDELQSCDAVREQPDFAHVTACLHTGTAFAHATDEPMQSAWSLQAILQQR